MFSCKPCASADPTSDTVKIDMDAAIRQQQAEEDAKKEGAEADVLAAREAQEREETEQRKLEEERDANAQAEAQAQAARLAAEQKAAAAAADSTKKAKEEQARRQAEEGEAKRLAEEQQAAAKKSAEQKLRQEEEALKAKQKADKAAEEAAAVDAEMKEKLAKVLKDYSVTDVNQKRKSIMSSRFPIHDAADKGDAEAVRVLLHFKADPAALNSSKKTPLQVAEKSKKRDEAIISMLGQSAAGGYPTS